MKRKLAVIATSVLAFLLSAAVPLARPPVVPWVGSPPGAVRPGRRSARLVLGPGAEDLADELHHRARAPAEELCQRVVQVAVLGLTLAHPDLPENFTGRDDDLAFAHADHDALAHVL